MPSDCLHINFSNAGLKQKLEALQPTPGFCIFVDITGSTAMKAEGLREWVAFIHNFFRNCEFFLSPFGILKGIGDEAMIYIEETDLTASGYDPLQIFDALWQIATENDPRLPTVKIGAAYCTQVYPITFLAGSRDYYGVDIDLAARLKGLAAPKSIVINDKFREKVMDGYRPIANQEQFKSVATLQGPESCAVNGIPGTVTIYRASRSGVPTQQFA